MRARDAWLSGWMLASESMESQRREGNFDGTGDGFGHEAQALEAGKHEVAEVGGAQGPIHGVANVDYANQRVVGNGSHQEAKLVVLGELVEMGCERLRAVGGDHPRMMQLFAGFGGSNELLFVRHSGQSQPHSLALPNNSSHDQNYGAMPEAKTSRHFRVVRREWSPIEEGWSIAWVPLIRGPYANGPLAGGSEGNRRRGKVPTPGRAGVGGIRT